MLMHIPPRSKVAMDILRILISHRVTFASLHCTSSTLGLFYPSGQDILREPFLIFYLLGVGTTSKHFFQLM